MERNLAITTFHGSPFHLPALRKKSDYSTRRAALVTGPKAEAFFERFCEHKIALVKADGKDILRVSLAHQQGKSEE